MAARKAEGRTLAQLAQEFRVARSTVQKGLADHAAAAPYRQEIDVEAIDVEKIVRVGLLAHEQALRRVTDLLLHEHPNAAIGAANAISRLLTSFVANLQRLGLVAEPDVERARLRLAEEARAVGQGMAQAVNDFRRAVDEADADADARAAARVAADDLDRAFGRLIAEPPERPRPLGLVLAASGGGTS